MLLIEGGARNLGRQFRGDSQFVQGLGPTPSRHRVHAKRPHRLTGPLTVNPKQGLKRAALPAGPDQNPYFSLSDLAGAGRSRDNNARREVVLFSDGVDPNNRRFDADDPYVEAPSTMPCAPGWLSSPSIGKAGPTSRKTPNTVNGGQSLLNELTQATGGYSYWSGMREPGLFPAVFRGTERRLEPVIRLEFARPMDRKPESKLEIESRRARSSRSPRPSRLRSRRLPSSSICLRPLCRL